MAHSGRGARAASAVRGEPERPTPASRTKQATARPPVNTTARMLTKRATRATPGNARTPSRSPRSNSHSLVNTFNPGSEAIAAAPTTSAPPTSGQRRRNPPRASRFRLLAP